MFRRLLGKILKTAGIVQINYLNVGDDSVVLMQLPEEITMAQVASFREHFKKTLGHRANRIVMYTGEIKITNIQMDELLTKIAEKSILEDDTRKDN
jgi:hypothetical protein